MGYQGVHNAANFNTTAQGILTVTGSIENGDIITVKVNNASYTYTVASSDTLATVVQGIINSINTSNNSAGDLNVIASAYIHTVAATTTYQVWLTARVAGDLGDDISFQAYETT